MEGVEVKTKNKPDMFAIRFDKRKNSPVSICMVEVKSKIEALRYGSGLDDHLEGMEAYLSMEGKNELLMNYRKREACKILNQYHELELYGVAKEYQVEDFMKLNNEIVFIFTNGLNLESNVHRGITVGSILKGYDAYDKIVSGDNAGGEIVAVKKKY